MAKKPPLPEQHLAYIHPLSDVIGPARDPSYKPIADRNTSGASIKKPPPSSVRPQTRPTRYIPKP